MPTAYVYAYLRSVSSKSGDVGSPYYIGMGRGKRAFVKHSGSISVPKSKEAIIILASNLEVEDAWELERWLIEGIGRQDLGAGPLRNLTDGGDGPKGYCHTEEAKRKISNSLVGNKRTVGNQNRKGKTFSFETRKKISLSRRRGRQHHNPKYDDAN